MNKEDTLESFRTKVALLKVWGLWRSWFRLNFVAARLTSRRQSRVSAAIHTPPLVLHDHFSSFSSLFTSLYNFITMNIRCDVAPRPAGEYSSEYQLAHSVAPTSLI